MKEYYLVEGHLGGDYWIEVNPDDPDQVDWIEATCHQCGDNDWIVGSASTKKEAYHLCKKYYEGTDYWEDMYESFLKEIGEGK